MKRSFFPTDLSAIVPSRIVLAMCIAGAGTCFAAPPNTVEEAARIVAAVTDPDPIKQTQKRAEKAREILEYRIGAIDVHEKNHIPPRSGLTGSDQETLHALSEQIWAEKDKDGGDSASLAWKLQMGTCTEHSELMVKILKGAGEKAVTKLDSTANHTFVVVNMLPDADHDIPSTWGPDAQISDSWLRKTLNSRTIWTEERAFNAGKEFCSSGGSRTPEGGPGARTTRQMLNTMLSKGPDYVYRSDIWPKYAERMNRVPVDMRRSCFAFPDGSPAPDPTEHPFTGSWICDPATRESGVLSAELQDKGSEATGSISIAQGVPELAGGTHTIKSANVKATGVGVKQFSFQLDPWRGVMRYDARDQLIRGSIQLDKEAPAGSPFTLRTGNAHLTTAMREFVLNRAGEGTGRPTGGPTKLGMTVINKKADVWIVPPGGGKRAIGNHEEIPPGTRILLGDGATIEALLAPAASSDPGKGMKLASAGATDLTLDGEISLHNGQVLCDSQGSDAQAALSLPVETPNALVTPLGTRYNVRFDVPKQTTTVTVSAGSVRVTPTLTSQQPALLNAGEYVIVGPAGIGRITRGEPGTTAGDGPAPDGAMPPFDGDVDVTDPVGVPIDKGPALWADSRSVLQGQVTWLPVWAFQVRDLASLNAELGYDAAALRAEGARPTAEVGHMLFEGNTNEAGTVRLGWAGQRGTTGEHQMAAVGFRAIGAPGQRVPVRVKVTESVDSSGAPAPLATADGMILIVANRPWAALDASRALKMSVGLLPEERELDVNADARVTSRDAVVILQLANRRRAL
jgi:hypothetical protein